MTINQLRRFLDQVSQDAGEFQIIVREFEDEGDNLLVSEMPLTAFYIDEESKNAVFLDEDNWQYFQKNLYIIDDQDSGNDEDPEIDDQQD